MAVLAADVVVLFSLYQQFKKTDLTKKVSESVVDRDKNQLLQLVGFISQLDKNIFRSQSVLLALECKLRLVISLFNDRISGLWNYREKDEESQLVNIVCVYRDLLEVRRTFSQIKMMIEESFLNHKMENSRFIPFNLLAIYEAVCSFLPCPSTSASSSSLSAHLPSRSYSGQASPTRSACLYDFMIKRIDFFFSSSLKQLLLRQLRLQLPYHLFPSPSSSLCIFTPRSLFGSCFEDSSTVSASSCSKRILQEIFRRLLSVVFASVLDRVGLSLKEDDHRERRNPDGVSVALVTNPPVSNFSLLFHLLSLLFENCFLSIFETLLFEKMVIDEQGLHQLFQLINFLQELIQLAKKSVLCCDDAHNLRLIQKETMWNYVNGVFELLKGAIHNRRRIGNTEDTNPPSVFLATSTSDLRPVSFHSSDCVLTEDEKLQWTNLVKKPSLLKMLNFVKKLSNLRQMHRGTVFISLELNVANGF
jgi:hypothetical protein